jgi:pimeloyl-ACP methyl ester carboxylesterase
MKRVRFRFVFAVVLITAALLSSPAYTSAATGRQMAESAISSLKAASTSFSMTRNVPSLYWTWFEVDCNDGAAYPLTVDFLGSNFSTPKGIVYMLPGGGMNFKSSFLTPLADNLAQYFRKSGYLVVGITPREDNVPATVTQYGFMKSWGMGAHLQDIRKIIGVIQGNAAFAGKPFRVLGHSFGAAYALDYASKCSDLGAPVPEKVIALDIYSFAPGTENSYYSGLTCEGFRDIIDVYGQYADASYSSIKSLMLVSALLPYVISPESYAELDRYFTYEGFLYYSMIESHELPSVQTGDWPLAHGYVAGTYTKNPCNPFLDSYSLAYSSMSTLREASLKVGSGLVPYAVYRDFFAVNAYNGTYSIDWENITSKVLWVNTGLGYNENMAGASLIPQVSTGTCPHSVLTFVLGGFGHLDILSNNYLNTRGTATRKANWYWLTYPDYPRIN